MDKIVGRAAAVATLAAGILVATATTTAADSHTSSASGDGVLAGNSVVLDLDVPITFCNALAALLGVGEGGCATVGVVTPDATQTSASGDGVATGNAITIDLDLPITLSDGAGATNPCCPPPTTPCCVPTTCCVPPTTCCVPPTTVPPPGSPPSTPPPTTVPPTTVPPTTVPPTTGPPVDTTAPEVEAARAVTALPETGTSTGPLVALGAGVLAAGFALVSLSNRFRSRPSS